MSNGTSTVSKSCNNDSKMSHPPLIPLQSGTMSESSTVHPGVDEWISSLPLRPANPTPRQGVEREPAMIGTSSQIHSESLAKYSPEESMWKTSPDSQLSLKMDDQATSQKSLVDFPRSGMTVGGTLYPRKTLRLRINERGGGLLPTPSATKIWPNTANTEDLVDSKGNPWTIGKKPYDRRTGRPVTTALADVGQRWTTPTAQDSKHSGKGKSDQGRDLLAIEVQWNTPNTMDGMAPKSQKALNHEHDTARPGRKNPNNLRDQVAVQEGLRLWPTPTGDDANNATRTSGAFQSLTRASGSSPTGQRSAAWVCWLMGLPLGWDSLDPLPEGAYEEWLEHMEQGTWWAEERGLPRLVEGQKDRVNRLKCLGNGIVPASGALAFITLAGE